MSLCLFHKNHKLKNGHIRPKILEFVKNVRTFVYVGTCFRKRIFSFLKSDFTLKPYTHKVFLCLGK